MTKIATKENETIEESCTALCYLMEKYPLQSFPLWIDLHTKSKDLSDNIKDHYISLAANSMGNQHPISIYNHDQQDISSTDNEDQIDIIVYFALAEEFYTLFDELIFEYNYEFIPIEDDEAPITYYTLKIPNQDNSREYKIALISPAQMGNNVSGSVVSMYLSRWKNPDVVVIGIAGSISDDLNPGDVFIPSIVKGYLDNSAVSDTALENSMLKFDLSGKELACNGRLVNRFIHFRLKPDTKNIFKKFIADAADRKTTPKTPYDEKLLSELEINVTNEISVVVGDDKKLASGPAVGKKAEFIKWLKLADRKFTALEMESIGALTAGDIRDPKPRIVVIRGISDIADERKSDFEKATSNQFRNISLVNAVELLISAIKADLFNK